MRDPFGPIGPLGAIARPGKPGDPVPEVDPEDIKTVFKEHDELAARHPGERVAIGLRAIQASLLERALADNRVSAPRAKHPALMRWQSRIAQWHCSFSWGCKSKWKFNSYLGKKSN
jgi:hypothetical protein